MYLFLQAQIATFVVLGFSTHRPFLWNVLVGVFMTVIVPHSDRKIKFPSHGFDKPAIHLSMSTREKRYDVIVIGGGASGMMAAGRAAERGRSVLLLEKNTRPGKKLDTTGGGRCNITNAEFDVHVLLKHYGAAEQFLYSPFSQFGVRSTFDFFEGHGLPLVVEARKRVFPVTQKATDVTRTLKDYLIGHGVEISTGTTVKKIHAANGRITEVVTSRGTFAADNFILAVGGASHPETGSTGDGFDWLSTLGHTVIPPTPTLVPLRVRDAWVKKLAGITLPNMKITFFVDGKRMFAKKGRLLFTHFGLSGPLILNSAHLVRDLLSGGTVTCAIDAFPDTDFSALEKRIIATIDANKNKNFKNVINDVVPAGMGSAYISLLKLPDPGLKAHSLTKEDRKRFVHLLKAAPAAIESLMGYDRAIVSDGGIPLAEVDMRTMHSLKIPNLFLIGDVLHINRPSGGYSLQLCWTTGFVAGSNT